MHAVVVVVLCVFASLPPPVCMFAATVTTVSVAIFEDSELQNPISLLPLSQHYTRCIWRTSRARGQLHMVIASTEDAPIKIAEKTQLGWVRDFACTADFCCREFSLNCMFRSASTSMGILH
mgnify:CR=1 FL=1